MMSRDNGGLDMDLWKRAARRAGDALRRIASVFKPYQPMATGQAHLDQQYSSGEWDYLRSIEEAPRLGIVAAYCRRFAPQGKVLEIGCGDAILFEHLMGADFALFTGVDISQVAIDRVRGLTSPSVEFIRAEAEDFTPTTRYDVIVFNEVLEYFNDPAAVVRRYEDFLAPGGCFVASAFSGWDTSRSTQIWRALDRRYSRVATTKVRTARRFQWQIRAFKPPEAA